MNEDDADQSKKGDTDNTQSESGHANRPARPTFANNNNTNKTRGAFSDQFRNPLRSRDSSYDRDRPSRTGFRPRAPLDFTARRRENSPHISQRPNQRSFQPFQSARSSQPFQPFQPSHPYSQSRKDNSAQWGQPPSFEQFQRVHNFFTRMNWFMPSNRPTDSTGQTNHQPGRAHDNWHENLYTTPDRRQSENRGGAMAPPPPPPPNPPPSRRGRGGRGDGEGAWFDQERAKRTKDSLESDLHERESSTRGMNGKGGNGMRWEKLGSHTPCGSASMNSNTTKHKADDQTASKARRGSKSQERVSKVNAANMTESGEGAEIEAEAEGMENEKGEEGDAEDSESEREQVGVSGTKMHAATGETVTSGVRKHGELSVNKKDANARVKGTNPNPGCSKDLDDENVFFDARENRETNSDGSNDSITVTDEYIQVKTPGVEAIEAMYPPRRRRRRPKSCPSNTKETGKGLGTAHDPVHFEASQQPPSHATVNTGDKEANTKENSLPQTAPSNDKEADKISAKSATDMINTETARPNTQQQDLTSTTQPSTNEATVSQTGQTVGTVDDASGDAGVTGQATSQSEDAFQQMVDRVNLVTAAREGKNELPRPAGGSASVPASPFIKPRQTTLTAGGSICKSATEESDFSESGKSTEKAGQQRHKPKKKTNPKQTFRKKQNSKSNP